MKIAARNRKSSRISLFDSYFLGTCDWTNPSAKSCKTIVKLHDAPGPFLQNAIKWIMDQWTIMDYHGLTFSVVRCVWKTLDSDQSPLRRSSCSSKSRRSFNSSAVAFRRRSSCEWGFFVSWLPRMMSPTWIWWRGQTIEYEQRKEFGRKFSSSHYLWKLCASLALAI